MTDLPKISGVEITLYQLFPLFIFLKIFSVHFSFLEKYLLKMI